MESHKIKNIKKNIYYEYIDLINLEARYHLVSIDSENINLIIPNTYQIDYLQSNNSYDSKGHIYFSNEKNKYSLDYTKREYNSFKTHMDHKKNNIEKIFTNYRNQEFYEVMKNNEEYIYMYFNGYYFKLFTNHKMSINEYYDMYLILLSITYSKLDEDIELLKQLYYFDKNSIYSICNDIDLISKDLSSYVEDVDINYNSIVVSNDIEYLEYKSKKAKVDVLSKNLILNLLNNDEISLDIMFKFANLGTYKVVIKDYNEIIDSDELSEDDKKSLLCKMIEQKQNEIYSNRDKINGELYNYIIKYLSENLTYSLWDSYHIREFLNMNKFEDDLNDKELYDVFMSNILGENILNMMLVEDSIISHELIIYPNKYVLRLSLLNGLLNSLKIIFDEDYNLVELNK